MRERGMIFNDEMVRAVLEGRKTQTRRVVKWRDLKKGLNLNFTGLRVVQQPTGWVIESDTRNSSEWRCEPTPCPFGAVGDRLWVRETCYAGELIPSGLNTVIYSADESLRLVEGDDSVKAKWQKLFNYRGGNGLTVPSIHMPRWASRITLEITGVRVERLQDISEADAIAEGGTPYFNIDWLSGLWAAIYGVESWQANPWVWVIEFKRVEGE